MPAAPDLFSSILQPLTNAQTINTLLGMDTRVKTATLALTKRLMDTAPGATAILSSKLPSTLLSHLDATDVPLCKSAFECTDLI